jgi:glycosyltransferase involved in cell wall biosynthesis
MIKTINSQEIKKILILCPRLELQGGVAHYYYLVHKYFKSQKVQLKFQFTGNDNKNRAKKCIRDLFSIIKLLPNFDLIVLNPSLDPRAITRDGLYHFVAKRIFNLKTLVFIHGWDINYEQKISKYGKKLFKIIYNFDQAIVLCSLFKKKLIKWGYYPSTIRLETTTYEYCNVQEKKSSLDIVFLSRFTSGKGCLIAIKAIELLSVEIPNIKLYMAGEGELKPSLEEYVRRKNLDKNVVFTGWVKCKMKYKLLSKCGIMLYPTSYGEGMPISIIEGMGMGLAIITRPVAGISDIFVNGINGFLVKSLNPEDFTDKARQLINCDKLWRKISNHNMQYAKNKFEINSVVKRLETLYYNISI